ncbi:hypothetical protein QYE76_061011 [Lolium multiflorum]|uniref:Uncharacterized protein n=1 Tax=Lolium multiflorum TaxID=4521 RepID=A0AAD8RZX5_LOLMU|nr:hypothetical protein QYE76_061011 [Lolium multiflorum]
MPTGDCHSSPFHVVFAYSDVNPGVWVAGSIFAVQTFVCVYNFETGSSGCSPVATICVENYFDWKLSAVSRNDVVVF